MTRMTTLTIPMIIATGDTPGAMLKNIGDALMQLQNEPLVTGFYDDHARGVTQLTVRITTNDYEQVGMTVSSKKD